MKNPPPAKASGGKRHRCRVQLLFVQRKGDTQPCDDANNQPDGECRHVSPAFFGGLVPNHHTTQVVKQ